MTRSSNGGLWSDFQKFLTQGNVVDLAVAVIIGGAFGKIVESFVADVITPAILSPALEAARVRDLKDLVLSNGIKYGAFLAAIINFVVIAFSIFLMIRALEQAKKKLERKQELAAEASPPDAAIVIQERTADTLDRLTRALEARNL